MIKIRQINKEIRHGDGVILHRNCIGKIMSNKCQCLNKDGFWIKWSGSHVDGSFYSMDDEVIRNIKVIEILIYGVPIEGDSLSDFLDKVIDIGIDVNSDTMQLSWGFLI